ncbi:MAG: peptidoglycan-binding protein [Clostridia bacterium]|nr:peptidoglycan-binding protein [Clostridia bacterium]
MLINLSDERNRIEVLQRMLRYLSFIREDEELRIPVSGNYDQASENAVRSFQLHSGQPVTGVTDDRTWQAIADAYTYEKRRREPVQIRVIPSDPDYVTGTAERSDTVLLLQIMLRALALRYDYPVLPPLSGVYGIQTADAVRYFQAAAGLEETGKADRETWRWISEEYNTLALTE